MSHRELQACFGSTEEAEPILLLFYVFVPKLDSIDQGAKKGNDERTYCEVLVDGDRKRRISQSGWTTPA